MDITPQINEQISKDDLFKTINDLLKAADADELLSKKDLCGRVLNMDVNTAERHVINQKGFPYVMVGTLKRYPKKAVEEWIKENTQYTNY